MQYSAYRRFPGSFDPSARKYTRMDSLRHGREKQGHVMQYSDGLGWQSVEAYQVSEINLVTYTSSGTYNPPVNLVYCEVIVVGGGGAGGNANTPPGAGGGGGGGTAKKSILGEDLNSSETVTIGAGGTVSALAAGNGGNGGTSSFGSHCSASGGTGGRGAGSTRLGGPGGIGSGGDENTPGESGGDTTDTASGKGGNSSAGIGAPPTQTDGDGTMGTGLGAGGSGAIDGGTNSRGGAGTAGAVYIREYLA